MENVCKTVLEPFHVVGMLNLGILSTIPSRFVVMKGIGITKTVIQIR